MAAVREQSALYRVSFACVHRVLREVCIRFRYLLPFQAHCSPVDQDGDTVVTVHHLGSLSRPHSRRPLLSVLSYNQP